MNLFWKKKQDAELRAELVDELRSLQDKLIVTANSLDNSLRESHFAITSLDRSIKEAKSERGRLNSAVNSSVTKRRGG